MLDFQVKIAGAAGEGAMAVGLLVAKALSKAGLFVYNYNEYPSLIRGGHNTACVRASSQPVGSLSPKIEILVALNSQSFKIHQSELVPGGILLWDQTGNDHLVCKTNLHCIHIPLRDLAGQIGNPIVLNTIAFGALAASLNFPLAYINQSLESEFGRKGKKIVGLNQKAAKVGFDFVHKNYQKKLPADLGKLIEDKEDKDRVVVSGNEACALGALAAGCHFYAGYPMTPSTGIFHSLAEYGPKMGLIFKQAEDEIAAINMVIGASFAGARAMTATSGGGFALMTEAVGLAAQTETPLVVVEAMRPGPATGLPTWSEQGDLRQVLHAGQGDFPRVIFAPGDSDEAFRLTHLAFDLADEFQLPVIILIDKNLAESPMSARWLSADEQKFVRKSLVTASQLRNIKEYKRYKITEDGISARTVPGQVGGQFIANSDEHNEFGFSDESAQNRQAMVEKRFRKVEYLNARLPSVELFGSRSPDVTLFGFGSTKWPIKEAVEILIERGIKAAAVHLPVVWPLPKIQLEHAWEKAKTNIIIENNFSGQLEGLLRQETGITFDYHLQKFDGRPFLAEEIVEYVRRKI